MLLIFFLIVRKETKTRTISILLLLKGPGKAYGGPTLQWQRWGKLQVGILGTVLNTHIVKYS